MRPANLFEAIESGDAAALAALLAADADVDEIDFHQYQATPLAHACDRGATAMVQALLAAGAEPDAADADGQRPLHLALRHGIPALVQALIEAGANPFLRDRAGRCPADWAPAGTGRNAKAIAALLAV